MAPTSAYGTKRTFAAKIRKSAFEIHWDLSQLNFSIIFHTSTLVHHAFFANKGALSSWRTGGVAIKSEVVHVARATVRK